MSRKKQQNDSFLKIEKKRMNMNAVTADTVTIPPATRTHSLATAPHSGSQPPDLGTEIHDEPHPVLIPGVTSQRSDLDVKIHHEQCPADGIDSTCLNKDATKRIHSGISGGQYNEMDESIHYEQYSIVATDSTSLHREANEGSLPGLSRSEHKHSDEGIIDLPEKRYPFPSEYRQSGEGIHHQQYPALGLGSASIHREITEGFHQGPSTSEHRQSGEGIHHQQYPLTTDSAYLQRDAAETIPSRLSAVPNRTSSEEHVYGSFLALAAGFSGQHVKVAKSMSPRQHRVSGDEKKQNSKLAVDSFSQRGELSEKVSHRIFTSEGRYSNEGFPHGPYPALTVHSAPQNTDLMERIQPNIPSGTLTVGTLSDAVSADQKTLKEGATQKPTIRTSLKGKYRPGLRETDSKSTSGKTGPTGKPVGLNYGTFRQNRQKRPRRARSVAFDLSSDTDSQTDKDSLIDKYPAASQPGRLPGYRSPRLPRLDDSGIWTKEDVDNLLDDASETVRLRPDRRHWGHVLLACTFGCPPCGIASAIFALKSKRCHDRGEKDSALRMLRHSDFCLRLAAIAGILLWFFLFLFFVIYKM